MKPQLIYDEVNLASFIPNARIRFRKLPSSYLFHR